jgi:hypothetical protein
MKTFAKVLVDRNRDFVLIEIILCDSSVYWRYSCETTVYPFSEKVKHNDPLLYIYDLANRLNWRIIGYEIL